MTDKLPEGDYVDGIETYGSGVIVCCFIADA